MLALEDDPARHLNRSVLFAKHKFRGRSSTLPAITTPSQIPSRLRIGYFSGDFHSHPVMQLIVKMFALHDRSSFEVHAFSFGPDKDDEMYQRLLKNFDSFHHVHGLTDEGIAELARSENIDIAVDLTGYTQNTRSGIFAYRAAPIQVSYLGYPGSMGADFIDYLIADSTLIPEENQKFYSEKIVYMPDCYQVSDNSRPPPATDVTRAALGLPEAGFVFCCFNNNYKITPREFDIWMRLLGQVEDSVLWLRRSNQWVEENLKKETQARGIEPGRVIFADICGYSEYIARLAKADLFLDTFNYNAGAVANDALWCGLPVLTHQGQSYVARMVSSLLTAIDIPELITTTEADYEKLALDLATNPEKLKSLKAKLARNKDDTPLFNTEQFTGNIEAAYTEMYSRYVNGKKPEHLLVKEKQDYQDEP
jgi:predicted O-linked N-acetylglucosamine transferase (SPINDLY family)